MAYRVDYAPPVSRDLSRLPRAVLERVDQQLIALGETPRPHGAKKLTDRDNLWSLRVSDYRILYAIDDQARVVTIARVGHRSDVYR